MKTLHNQRCNPPPLLVRGTKAAGLKCIDYLSINSHCFSSYQAMFLCLYRTQNTPRSAPPNCSPRIWFHHKNPCVFEPFFKARKVRQIAPKASKKQHKSILKFIKNDFHEKSILAIHSMRKQRFVSPKRRKIESEIDKRMTWKQA